uniref:Uncharacterized protein n=1 Tax=Arion vulgaris TaxID=1028688 RepID=A0A0B6ZDY3_9EUPU
MSRHREPLTRDSSIILKGISANELPKQSAEIKWRQMVPANGRNNQTETRNLLALQMYSNIKNQRQFEKEKVSKISRADRKRRKLKEKLDAASGAHSSRSEFSFGAHLSRNHVLYGKMVQQQNSTFVHNQVKKCSSDSALRHEMLHTDIINDSTNTLTNIDNTFFPHLKESQNNPQDVHNLQLVSNQHLNLNSAITLIPFPSSDLKLTKRHRSMDNIFHWTLPPVSILSVTTDLTARRQK